MTTFQKKLQISIGSAALFTLVNLPQVYKLGNNILPLTTYNNLTKCPTNAGILLHTIVFFIGTYISMMGSSGESWLKLKNTIYSTLIFYMLSSPPVFSLINQFIGKVIPSAGSGGCPTIIGVLLLAVIYCFALIGVMYLPENNK